MNNSTCFRFGGLTFALSGQVPGITRHELLDAFVVPPCQPDYHVHVFSSPELDIPADGEILEDVPVRMVTRKNGRIWVQHKMYQNMTMWTYSILHLRPERPREPELQILQGNCSFTTENILSTIFVESILLRHGCGVLHSATVATDKGAILFTAPSGTGKSTQAALWQQYRGAEIINGDRIILRDVAGEEYAAGLPFAGSSDICLNREVPIRAVVFLSQAPENQVTLLRPLQALKLLLSQISVQKWNRDDIDAAMDVAERVISRIPVFHLACRPDEGAVIALEAALENCQHGRI